MRDGSTYRAARRIWAHEAGLLMEPLVRKQKHAFAGKRARWFKNNEKEAFFYTAAVEMLMTGPRSQRPTWRAIKKMMHRIASSPRITPPALKLPVPAIMMVARHVRGSWRMFA